MVYYERKRMKKIKSKAKKYTKKKLKEIKRKAYEELEKIHCYYFEFETTKIYKPKNPINTDLIIFEVNIARVEAVKVDEVEERENELLNKIDDAIFNALANLDQTGGLLSSDCLGSYRVDPKERIDLGEYTKVKCKEKWIINKCELIIEKKRKEYDYSDELREYLLNELE